LDLQGGKIKNQKSKGKRQKAKIRKARHINPGSSFLPFAFCLLPFDF